MEPLDSTVPLQLVVFQYVYVALCPTQRGKQQRQQEAAAASAGRGEGEAGRHAGMADRWKESESEREVWRESRGCGTLARGARLAIG